MVDPPPSLCCMCGDVGFPDKLFRCSKCRHRFQHSYCSNYYSEFADPVEVCEWCQCEEKNSSSSSRHGTSSSSSLRSNSKAGAAGTGSTQLVHANGLRSAYSGDKVKQHHREEGSAGGGSSSEKAAVKTPSPRSATRRYKLLKDVMC